MKSRVYNFGAGPATLPESILQEAQAELLDWQGHGMSIMEMGHRGPEFTSLMETLETDFRETLAIPEHYHVLFLGGAARTQFAMVPMNLLNDSQKAGYLISGIWSAMAYDEACRLKHAYCIESTESTGYRRAPIFHSDQILDDTSYVYYTPNETINGVYFKKPPVVGAVPLVADMTSCLLSEPINVADFGIIFAGAQKNIAPAGLTVVIIREDLLQNAQHLRLPTMLTYQTHAKAHSLYATPPTFNCYMAQKMLQWIKTKGGVTKLYQDNCQKAARLYDFIDNSSLYDAPVEAGSRSLMNVCFLIKIPNLEAAFLEAARAAGLYGLKGHRLVGGLRASLYNAMPMAGVDALIAVMQAFAEANPI